MPERLLTEMAASRSPEDESWGTLANCRIDGKMATGTEPIDDLYRFNSRLREAFKTHRSPVTSWYCTAIQPTSGETAAWWHAAAKNASRYHASVPALLAAKEMEDRHLRERIEHAEGLIQRLKEDVQKLSNVATTSFEETIEPTVAVDTNSDPAEQWLQSVGYQTDEFTGQWVLLDAKGELVFNAASGRELRQQRKKLLQENPNQVFTTLFVE